MQTNKEGKVKIFQVIVESIWNNLHGLGFYYELKDAVKDINKYTSTDNIEVKEDDLKEYASTFDYCFDLDLFNLAKPEQDELEYTAIRGFILWVSPETAKELVEGER